MVGTSGIYSAEYAELQAINALPATDGQALYKKAWYGAEALSVGAFSDTPEIVALGHSMLTGCLNLVTCDRSPDAYALAALHRPFAIAYTRWAEGDGYTADDLGRVYAGMEDAVRFGLAQPHSAETTTYLGQAVFLGLAARDRHLSPLILPARPSTVGGGETARNNATLVINGELLPVDIAPRRGNRKNRLVIESSFFGTTSMISSPFREEFLTTVEPLPRSQRDAGVLRFLGAQMVAEYEDALTSDGEQLLERAGSLTVSIIGSAVDYMAKHTS